MRRLILASTLLVLVTSLLLVPCVGPTAADDEAPEDSDPRVGTVLAVQGRALRAPGGPPALDPARQGRPS